MGGVRVIRQAYSVIDVQGWVGTVGGLAGFTSLGVTLNQQRKRRRVPDPALRDLLESLSTDFGDIIAKGGQPTWWFTKRERQQRHTRLASIHGAVVDNNLNDLVRDARAAYDDCFAFSAASSPNRRVEDQIGSAHAGRAAVDEAIDRFNLLSRKYGHL